MIGSIWYGHREFAFEGKYTVPVPRVLEKKKEEGKERRKKKERRGKRRKFFQDIPLRQY